MWRAHNIEKKDTFFIDRRRFEKGSSVLPRNVYLPESSGATDRRRESPRRYYFDPTRAFPAEGRGAAAAERVPLVEHMKNCGGWMISGT
jgi:hypothetical protein